MIYFICIYHKTEKPVLTIIQEYFQPKVGRKIGIFSPGRKNNILIKKEIFLSLKISAKSPSTFFSFLLIRLIN